MTFEIDLRKSNKMTNIYAMIRHRLNDTNWEKIYACLKNISGIYTGNEEKSLRVHRTIRRLGGSWPSRKADIRYNHGENYLFYYVDDNKYYWDTGISGELSDYKHVCQSVEEFERMFPSIVFPDELFEV